jgi:transposase
MTAFSVPSMLTQEEAVEIRVMARRGEGVRSIARQLGCSRNTVRRYLREEEARGYGPRAPRACKLDEYKGYLRERVEQAAPRWIPATVLLREIRERGYDGGISQLKAWLVPLKKSEPEPVVRFETAPGKQMQADFTFVRRGRDPLLALVATLGYSRASFVKFATCEDAATLCTGLCEAFDYFGGVPEHVLFDNTKAVVIERDAYGEGRHRWNDELKEAAETCGFMPRLCRPYRARTKGKVERFNSYLKSSFVVPLAATLEASGLRLDAEVANAHVRRWLDEVANARVHATTKAVPAVRLAAERAVMLPAPALRAAAPKWQRVALPVESLQHPLAVYDELLEVLA